MRLGWQPPNVKTPWDVLPLVLQASNSEPEFFEIPEEIVLSTAISHPEYVYVCITHYSHSILVLCVFVEISVVFWLCDDC